MAPSSPRANRKNAVAKFVTMHSGSAAVLSNVEPDLSFSQFILAAQRIDGAREILEAGPLAKAERSSEERKAASDCLSRPVVSLTFLPSPYNGLPDFTRSWTRRGPAV